MADEKIAKLPECREAATKPARGRAAELSKFRDTLRRKYGELPDSVDGIRAERG